MLLALLVVFSAQSPKPLLVRAHAHNDYEHTRPLLDALDQGFCSIEADIYLVDGELRVGHNRKDLRPGRTLEALYLDPLADRVKLHRGHVYDAKETVTLLVDVKAEAEAVYAELRKRLPKYQSMLTSYSKGKVKKRAVTVILSGERATATLRAEDSRLAFIDGRPEDLEGKDPATLIPLVSDSWSPTFDWSGTGAFPADKLARIRDLIAKAHKQGRKVRFWATPSNPQVWQLLWNEGVDYLNADDLVGLRKFILSQSKSKR